MSYENLNSTKILAQRCAICARPLRDAVSAEIGMGPDCREKYGYNEGVTEENRSEANRLIYLVADAPTKISAFDAAEGLRKLGFAKLANVIVDASVSVTMTREGDTLKIVSPYSEHSVACLKSVRGRRWDRESKVNTFPYGSKDQLWGALKRAFPGALLRTWQGVVIEIPRE